MIPVGIITHRRTRKKKAGKTVEVQEINDGKNLLAHLSDVLIKTLDL